MVHVPFVPKMDGTFVDSTRADFISAIIASNAFDIARPSLLIESSGLFFRVGFAGLD